MVMTRNQLSEPSFRNSTPNSGSSHGFSKKRLTSPIRGGVLDIVIGKLAPGQRASAPTDVQLKDSEYKFCKKKLNEVEGVTAWALLVASRSESSIVSLHSHGATPSLNRD
ncbi:hypothetical protein BGW80DRAFT_1255076 [Lactifluus volemus]|nr:hypothetical protein BGW80DRAFT_1255076 [Lactifluus volemus]